MNPENTTNDIIERWIAELPPRAPDRVLETVLAELPALSQEGRLRARLRRTLMSASLPLKFAGAAVAAVAVALVGLNLPATPGAGGVPLSPSPTGSPHLASARPFEAIKGRLEPGTYVISAIEPLEIRFTVPAGWERPPNAPEFLGPTGQSGREIGGLSFWSLEQLYADPCRTSPDHVLELTPDASVEEVSDALAAVWGSELSPPQDVSVSGFPGAYMELDAPCASVEYWVLDVDGVRLVMTAHTWPESTAAQAAELQQIVESVEIES